MKTCFTKCLFTIGLFFGFCNAVFAAETIFYVLRYHTEDRMTPPEVTFASLKNNYKKIDILIPQAYHIDASGEVRGEIEPAILDFAVSHHMKIMPLVTNSQFSKEVAKQFLANTDAQKKALQALLQICEANHFYGIQLDFEMVHVEDRDALSSFFQLAADEFHRHGFVISYSVAPVVTDQAGESHFLDKLYANWEGAYDFKKLGKMADFVSIMAYNQHGGATPPGPTASWEWTNQIVKHALKFMPSSKISLAIPDYSVHWYADTDTGELSGKMRVKMAAMNYEKAMNILRDHHATLQWDKQARIHYSIFSNHWLYEYLFIEDKDSFAAKNSLVKRYKLRGLSVFDLGTEDPRIWKLI